MMLLGPQINYMPSKSHVIVLLTMVALTTFTLVCIRCFTGEAVNKLHIK